tara:strand:- start:1866 stop:2354 length:489 start_codon:yes stop_codon:yes gene_type:complete
MTVVQANKLNLKSQKMSNATDVFKHIDMKDGDKDQCWTWKGKLNAKDGRPYITIEGTRRAAYRVVLELHTGERHGGRQALHSCDNRICCNPHHLRWGSHQDNMDDMKERDRHGLPKTVVRAITKLRNEGKTQKEVAELYGIARETISAIETGRSHKDLTNND